MNLPNSPGKNLPGIFEVPSQPSEVAQAKMDAFREEQDPLNKFASGQYSEIDADNPHAQRMFAIGTKGKFETGYHLQGFGIDKEGNEAYHLTRPTGLDEEAGEPQFEDIVMRADVVENMQDKYLQQLPGVKTEWDQPEEPNITDQGRSGAISPEDQAMDRSELWRQIGGKPE